MDLSAQISEKVATTVTPQNLKHNMKDYLLILLICLFLFLIWRELQEKEYFKEIGFSEKIKIIKKTFVEIGTRNKVTYEYDRYSPLIFIGGIR